MDRQRYEEMIENVDSRKGDLLKKKVFLFGHCEATLTLADYLLEKEIRPTAILDNSAAKYGQDYKGMPVVPPGEVLDSDQDTAIVLIVTRFYEAMNAQLRKIGFKGEVVKLVDYNTYAEYSLSEETRNRKKNRVKHGDEIIKELKIRYKDALIVFCPFNALGDIYFCMSYLPEFLRKRGVKDYAVCVPGKGCGSVVRLFGAEHVEVFDQNELDAAIQAVIHSQDERCFIAHQDRPYVVNLHKTLKLKKIPLEKVYCCGIFGLPVDTLPAKPYGWKDWQDLNSIREGKAVVLSPYAKSVTTLPDNIWKDIVAGYAARGYQLFTNVSGDEEPLTGTIALRADLCEMKSILERAGTFIGIRSGLCDVVRTASCRKIALYPDYNYCDTKWKSIDMYSIDGFENIVVDKDFQWEMN